ncbi:MAG: hypothetical protein Q9160_008501 [Pyrenula sp. 1 TL-2023]
MDKSVDFYPSDLRAKYHLDAFPAAQRHLSSTPSADIGWVPDLEKHNERTTRRLKDETLATNLPRGWPQALQGPLVWSGDDLKDQSRYIFNLHPSDIAEIEAAVLKVKNSSLGHENINRFTFPLPKLGPILEELSGQVHSECGFVVLRGLQPWTYSRQENIILYLGVSSYIGERRGRQNLSGAKLTHITDVKSAGVESSERRPIFSNLGQPFHADLFCDVLALYHLDTAKSGGETSLASSWKVYNEVAASRPDIIHTLAENDWIHDTRGCSPPYYQQSLLYNHDRKIVLNFSRRVLTGAPMMPRSKDIPPMTDTQAEALDAVHFCAQNNSLKINLKKGDMSFVNNLAVLHSRAAFEDDAENSRYAMRLWLNNPERAWKTPPALQLDWDRTYAPLEGIKDNYETDPFADKDKVQRMVKAAEIGPDSTRCG